MITLNFTISQARLLAAACEAAAPTMPQGHADALRGLAAALRGMDPEFAAVVSALKELTAEAGPAMFLAQHRASEVCLDCGGTGRSGNETQGIDCPGCS